MSELRTYACTGECNTCGGLWNTDGTPWHEPEQEGDTRG